MALLIIGLVLFLGMHMVRIMAPQLRENMIVKMGDGGWKMLYTVVSILGIVLIVYGYGSYRWEGPVIYQTPFWMGHITVLLMAVSFVLIVSGNIPATGYIKARMKNPMLIGVKVWAIAHLLANGDLASVLLFGSFLAWAVIAVIALKRRGGESPVASSAMPDYLSLAIGLVLWAVFGYWLHAWLIGVPAIA